MPVAWFVRITHLHNFWPRKYARCRCAILKRAIVDTNAVVRTQRLSANLARRELNYARVKHCLQDLAIPTFSSATLQFLIGCITDLNTQTTPRLSLIEKIFPNTSIACALYYEKPSTW